MRYYVSRKFGNQNWTCTEKNYQHFEKKLKGLGISEERFEDFLNKHKLLIVRLEVSKNVLILKTKGKNELSVGIKQDDQILLVKKNDVFFGYEISEDDEKIVQMNYSGYSRSIKFEEGNFWIVFKENKILTVLDAGDLTNKQIKIIFKSLSELKLQSNGIPKSEFKKLEEKIKSEVSSKDLKIISDYIV